MAKFKVMTGGRDALRKQAQTALFEIILAKSDEEQERARTKLLQISQRLKPRGLLKEVPK